MNKKELVRNVLAIGIGVPALVYFANVTNWQAALALFLAIFANNISQDNQ